MQAIQTASAVYLLALFAIAIFVVLQRAVTGESEISGNLSGIPAAIAAVAVVVCAVTTLLEVG